ncbi:MAG: TIGR01777 family oxidoreductase [Planctomycetota bacterium]
MAETETVAVSGASGLVGTALCESLEASGRAVKRLVRRPVADPTREIRWQPAAGEIDADGLRGVDAVVHLSGENVAGGRWTAARKRAIVDSRVDSTRLLCKTIAALPDKPRVLVSASAIGIYGNRPDESVDEESPAGEGFLAHTTALWEAETRYAYEAGIRVVQMRIGMVLSPDGGALAKLLPLFRLCLGGRLGDGKQVVSWISLPDLVRAFEHAIANESLHGAVNGVAPGAVTNAEFTKVLASVLGRCESIPAPAFALRLMVGEMASEVLLSGARVEPKRLVDSGFAFDTPTLEPALRAVLKA